MKLKKVLKYCDWSAYCQIYIDDDEEAIFTGFVNDVPWSLIDKPLNEEGMKNGHEWGPIGACGGVVNDYGTKFDNVLVFYVKEK